MFQCPGLIQSRCYLRYGLCCVTQGWARFRGTHRWLCLEELCEQRQKSCVKMRISMSFTVKSLRSLWRGRRCLSSQGGAMNVFDRSMKRRQKQWASSLLDSDKYDYLRDEVRRFITVMVRVFLQNWSCVNELLLSLCLQVASRLSDRVYDVSRSLPAYYIPFKHPDINSLKEIVHTKKYCFTHCLVVSTLCDFILFCGVEKEISSRMSSLLFTIQ